MSHHFSNADHVPVATLTGCKRLLDMKLAVPRSSDDAHLQSVAFQLRSLAPTFGAPEEPVPQGDGYKVYKA